VGATSIHPTKQLLLDTTVSLIDESGPQGFTVDNVLDTSGISKGSLYHHFHDFDDLISSAQVIRFSRSVDADIAHIIEAVRRSTSREDFLGKVKGLALIASSDERRRERASRAVIIGSSWGKPEFRAALAVEQRRLTDAFIDLVREVSERGWVGSRFSPQVVATFVQAYTFGRLVDDLVEDPVDGSEWGDLIQAVITNLLTGD
jgi:AcrR family transcriptional regulator